MSGRDADRWRELSPHLDRALEMPKGERDAWLAALRTEDPSLAADLLALLEERDALSQEGFLAGEAPSLPAEASLAGQTIGPYTLVSLMGQGGMGSVWLARRSDGRFEGRVAVKLLNAALVGRVGEERFKREGAILARLTHPHIAHLVDAGVSSGGQPYLVLEHVDGEHIDRHCDRERLGIASRIRLFLDVLAAVAHAHANLIVHRDIKPSNVLVGADGTVKLLDFGIAKLLLGEAHTGEPTALTREGGRAMTPEYAAPEQVTNGPITTATDVYALGCLLYLLLAGRHWAGDALRSPADLLKAIVDTEPARLSEALVRTNDEPPDTLAITAARRDATPDKLRRLLEGDLETIVAKALKKRPEERYASVTTLADDLRRHLDHRPISARPDTFAYRAAKFVRRNRASAAASALALLAMAVGLVGTASQAQRATRQAAVAEAQRVRADQAARFAGQQRDFALRQLSRAEAINDLNAFLLSDAAPSGRPLTVGELLAHAEAIVEKQRDATDGNRVEILIELGRLYDVRDEGAKARRLLGQAYDLSRDLHDPSISAKAACALASALGGNGEFGRAETLLREAEGALPKEPQFALHRIFCLLNGSEVAREAGEAKLGLERAQAAQGLLNQSGQPSPLLSLHVSMGLAESLRMAGRNREACQAFEAALATLTRLGRDDTETAGTLFNNWAVALTVLGQPLRAEALFRRAIRISSADGSDEGVSPMLLNNLARTLADLKRLGEARDYAERAYAKARRARDEVVVSQSLSQRARIYRELGDLARAEAMLAELEPRWKRVMAPGHVAFATLASHRALLAQARGDFPAARAAADQAVALAEASEQGADYLPSLLLRRADLDLRLGLPERARSDAARALRMVQAAIEPGTVSSELGRAHLAVGRAILALGSPDEARTAFAAALQNLQPSLGPDHPETREARRLLSIDASSR